MTEADLLQHFILDQFAEGLASGELQERHETTLYTGGQAIPVDLIVYTSHPPSVISLFQGKKTLDNKVVEQCERFIGFADYISAVVAHPGQRSETHNARRERLVASGIGLYYVDPYGRVEHVIPPRWQKVNNREAVLSAMTADQRPSANGPPAGSAAAKRIVPDKYDSIRSLIHDVTVEGGLACTMQIIRANLGHRYTADELREFSRDARKGRVRDVRVSGGIYYELREGVTV